MFGVTSQWLLSFIYTQVHTVAIFNAIGAYGVAIILMTVVIGLALAPLSQFQMVTQRRAMVEQRKLAPQVAELRKKYKNREEQNAQMMKLYQEHGINPLGQFVGCLPLLIQMPILTALFYVFRDWAPHSHVLAQFLFIPNLNDYPNHHLLITGLPVLPTPEYLIFPLLAAVTTFIQSRMLQMPPPPNPTEQELQTQQMQRTMIWMSPLMIAYFALNVPAGLGLYWFVRNIVSIIQQSFVVGWGPLVPARFRTVAGGAPTAPGRGQATASKAPSPPSKGQTPPSKGLVQPNNPNNPNRGQTPQGNKSQKNSGKRKRHRR